MIGALDTTGWEQVITLLCVIIVGVMNKLDARKAVKATVDAAKIAVETKILVNSNMGLQLRKSMLQTRRIADMTGKPEDIRVADEDEALYKRHLAAQAVIDAANELIAHTKDGSAKSGEEK